MHLGLFMTFDVSLASWHQTGIFEREVALYRRLAERGVDVTFFSYGGADDLAFADRLGPIRVLPLASASRAPKSPAMRRLWSLTLPWRHRAPLRSVSLFKTNQMLGAWVAVLAKWLTRKPLVVRCGFEYHRFLVDERASWLRRTVWRALSSIVYKAADLVVVTSEADLQYVRSVFGVKPPRAMLIPNYVETDRFLPSAGPGQPAKRVLCIARLEQQKNLFALVEALRGTDIELDIIGEGSLRAGLEAAIKRDRPAVRLLGRMPSRQLPERMSQYAAFVMPSLYEGHPKALLEAMSCGMAVIATNVVGLRELIDHGQTGYVCEPTPDSIRAALQAVLADEPLRRRMGENAREMVLRRFTLDRVVDLELDAYRQVTQGAP